MGEGSQMGTMKLSYTIEQIPPIQVCFLLGFQQFLTAMAGSIAMPLIVAEAACFGPDIVARSQLMGTVLVVNGICTLLQINFGCRLPILQGASFGFLAPIVAMASIDEFRCPSAEEYENGTLVVGSEEHQAMWMSRMTVVQGSIVLSGIFETILGATGLVGLFVHYVGPLTIAPTTALIGFCLIEDVVDHYASKHWPIALMALIFVIIFCLFLNELQVPLPSASFSILKKPRTVKFGISWQPVFGLFPILLAMLGSWAICSILTVAGAFPSDPHSGYGYMARTDIRTSQLHMAPWFRVPYPGQWGTPSIFVAMVLGMCAGSIASIVESIGDYCACARMCGVPRPPPHAINRGIMAEGIGCIVAGIFGSGPGVTSYSENIGAIGITGVASRRVTFVTACLLLVIGCITKISTVFVSIPSPVIGGIFIAMFSMVASVGFSNLQFVDLNSTRNLFIFGISMFMGIAMPSWVKRNNHLIKTGSDVADQIIVVLLSTGMLVGGAIGFMLDNTVPGATRRQRGLDVLEVALTGSESIADLKQAEVANECYNLPYIGNWIASKPILRFIPFSPTFKPKYLAELDICGAIKRRFLRPAIRPTHSAAYLEDSATSESGQTNKMQDSPVYVIENHESEAHTSVDGLKIKTIPSECSDLNLEEARF